MAQVVAELHHLGLECLDPGWVRAIHDSEFLEFINLPSEYETLVETLDFRSAFKDVMNAIDVWLADAESPEEKSWTSLSQKVDHEKILALLAYYIDHGCKNVVNKDNRDNALFASRVYYKLLSIPGYKAYHIYHSQLFVNSLVCLSIPKLLCDNENNYFNARQLTSEVNSTIKQLSRFAVDLRAIIEQLKLNPSDMNFENILSNLLDITGGAIVNKLHIDKIEFNNLTGVIYEIIDLLITNGGRQPNSMALKILFKCLLPKLVHTSLETRNSVVRASYVTYSGLLLTKYGTAALQGYMLLLQHLCYSQEGLERHEVRNARVTLVSGLMSLLPRKSYHKIVKWLIQLSTTSRVPHRQVALEVLYNLLNNEPEPEVQRQAENNPAGDPNTDDSGIVVDHQPSDNSNDSHAEQQPTGDNQQRASTGDESSLDSQLQAFAGTERDDLEDIMRGLIRQRRHTVPHGEILRAVFARAYDVSSTLRTRALVILADCLANNRPHIMRAIKELNGNSAVSRLIAVSTRSVCDERAVVRRAGVALVTRLLAAPAPPPQPADLAILVNLCRDASIIVRSSAIAALGDLGYDRPSDAVYDAFLSGPMQQLSDPENKVQDQVVALIEQILVARLRVYVEGENEDLVPWMFLAAITRRNMKRHLEKACQLLTNTNGSINHSTVDVLSTHLGVLDDERDLQCLVLLTSLARFVDYPNVGFVFNYYYKIAENEEGRDARLMPLAVELTSCWSRFAQQCEKTALRDHLVQRLAAARDDGCRISCATLAAQIDPSNLTWATELMQLSERRAVEGGDIEESIRAADLSLVAPVPPSLDLIKLFNNALMNPNPEWSAVMLGSLVAGAGRVCVRAREVAVQLAPGLAAVLRRAHGHVPARVNALLALTDICIRYTSIMEPLLGSVCDCLALSAPSQLRRATAKALTRLFLGDYLRLRPPLYFRYCALLADEDDDVREPAEYHVTSCVAIDTVYCYVVDCIVYYNKEENPENKMSPEARQLIYDVMLQRLNIVQKLNVQCRIARELFEHAADHMEENNEDLPPDLTGALLDAITLLCGPRMKLPKKPQSSGDAADIDELQERVTTNIVSVKMKRTVAELLVPAVLRLHTCVRARGGPLADALVRIATELLNDYRQEVEELIDNDEEMVEHIQLFQASGRAGQTPTFGNARNLVTSSAPPEPDTPRTPRRRPRSALAHPPRKRALRI